MSGAAYLRATLPSCLSSSSANKETYLSALEIILLKPVWNMDRKGERGSPCLRTLEAYLCVIWKAVPILILPFWPSSFLFFLVFFVFVFLNLLKDQEWPDYYIYLSAQISVATKTASWIYLPPTKASWVESDFLKDPVTQIRNLAIIL